MKILNAVRHDIQILIRRLSVFILFSVNMQQLINCAILNQIPGVWFLVLAYIIFVYCTCNWMLTSSVAPHRIWSDTPFNTLTTPIRMLNIASALAINRTWRYICILTCLKYLYSVIAIYLMAMYQFSSCQRLKYTHSCSAWMKSVSRSATFNRQHMKSLMQGIDRYEFLRKFPMSEPEGPWPSPESTPLNPVLS